TPNSTGDRSAGTTMDLLEFVVNIGLAALLGAVVGLERQWNQHPAGLRTNALVALGAALFVSLTPLLGEPNSPTRIASYMVAGVGFLCGGVISKHGATTHGLTTAAGIWCSAALGTLTGLGFRLHAVIGTVFVLLILFGIIRLDYYIDALHRRFGKK